MKDEFKKTKNKTLFQEKGRKEGIKGEGQGGGYLRRRVGRRVLKEKGRKEGIKGERQGGGY